MQTTGSRAAGMNRQYLLRLVLLAALPLPVGCASRGAADGAPAHVHDAPPPAHVHEAPPARPAHGDAATHGHAHELPATAGPGYTVADVHFMQMMIGHHAQALAMAILAPTRAGSGQVLQLADKIDISQRDEIAMMRSWLAERGQAVPEDAHLHAMRMPGMVTAEQLAQLEAARGRDFDRLFLELMIDHHDGALEMADALFASPGAGQDPDIFRFVTDLAADQLDEIGVMRHMLEQFHTHPGA